MEILTGAGKDLLKDWAINILGWLDKIETMDCARTANIAENQSSLRRSDANKTLP
jgi:hypothetical protein